MRWVCAVLIALMSYSVWADEDNDAIAPALRLGKRLFLDKRFTNPASNVPGSCDGCHRPEWAPGTRRAYSDSERYSLVPTHFFGESTKRTTLRNVPSLMDIAGQVRFNHDGRFATLEDAIAAEFTSPHLGWLPSERESALDEIHWVLLSDERVDRIAEGTYIEQFKRVYGIDLQTMTREKAVGWVVKCLAEYVTSLKSTRTSAFDAFTGINRLPPRPKKGESAEAFGESLLARVTGLEARTALKFHPGFSREAYAGFKIFMRTTGKAKTGNCVACHSPPLFTDGSFHNTGIAQAEYDAAHGSGSFGKLPVPNAAEARRPVERFGPKLKKGEQVNADLGYWNFVERTQAASERKEGGSFLAAAAGAFKTPTLRNLKHTDPYMHNGAYRTLEEAVAQKVKACALAKSGALRSGDGALSVMNITKEDIAPLIAFLTTLNDVPVEEFEAYRRSLPVADAQERSIEEKTKVHRLSSTKRAVYDAFTYVNRIPEAAEKRESARDVAGRIFGRLANQEGRILLKLPPGMDRDSYLAFKTFFRYEGKAKVGNCAACHTPAEFTDSQAHVVTKGGSPTVTPSLRNLKKRKVDLRKAIMDKITASHQKRSGKADEIDDAYAEMNISEKDVSGLEAFLSLLNDVSDADFRGLVLRAKLLDTAKDIE